MALVTITAGQPGTKDTHINEGNKTTNYGSSMYLVFGKDTSLTGHSAPLIQFDTPSIPQGSTINSAIFKGVVTSAYRNTSNSYINAKPLRITSPWNEMTVNYNTRPSKVDDGDAAVLITGYNYVDDVLTWDITSTVSKWVSEGLPNYGIFFDFFAVGANNTWASATIAAREYTNKTRMWKVEIDYTPPPPKPTPPTLITPNGGETWDKKHLIEWAAKSYVGEIAIMEDFEDTNYVFPNSGDWLRTSAEVKSGVHSFTHRYVADYDVARHDFTINVPVGATNASLSMDILPSTEGNYDYLEVFIDGNPKDKLSGIHSWVNRSYPITTAGNHTLRIAYQKDGSGAAGLDKVFIDNLTLTYSGITAANTLHHEAQLSTDNGATWKELFLLISAGVTEYEHDFTNEPSTSLAKVRVRSYDSASKQFSDWTESAGVFTISHNRPPTQPTNLKANASVVAKDDPVTLTFQHNDVDGDSQSKFDLQWKKQGETAWNYVPIVSTQSRYAFAPNTLPLGVIEWKVRTYDTTDAGSVYSEVAVFTVAERPPAPTILAPTNNQTISIANPALSWSAISQAGYTVRVLDSTKTNTLWSVSPNSANKALTIGYNLLNNMVYVLAVSIRTDVGLSSAEAFVTISVSYTAAQKPNPLLTPNGVRGFISMDLINPPKNGSEPDVIGQDVYRRKNGETAWKRIAKDIPANGTFNDYLIESGTSYNYYVRTHGSNGTFTDSNIYTSMITLEKPILASVANPSKFVQFKLGAESSVTKAIEGRLAVFAGRTSALAEFGYGDSTDLSISFMTTDLRDVESVENLLHGRETLIYREPLGRKEFVVFFNMDLENVSYRLWKVSLSPNKVYFDEEV